MNLMEESFKYKEENNKKGTTKIILGAIILIVILIIGIVTYLIYIESTTLKVVLDGQTNEKVKQLLKIEDDGTIYAPIKEIASYLGYDSYNGEYTEKSEEASKCYVQNENEVANFALSSNKIYKLDLTKDAENYEYVYTKKPVKADNGVLYASSEAIEKAFNVVIQYDQDKKRIYIYTMPYLIKSYSNKVLDYGYSEISEVFANQKAIMNDMLVVKKGENKDIYGVIDLEGKAVLEPKYDNITYLPNIGDFLVETDGKVGILSASGETKIQIAYDSIELMDSDAGLYVVKKENKYGVLDLRGNFKIHIENDAVGMDISKFEENNIKSKYLLAGNLIPVQKNKLWGLYDKNGNQLVDFKYDSFGYIAASGKDVLNLLVIPDYNVIVACKDKKYTLLSSTGEELFAAPVADDIYMTISGGKRNYYITANNGKMDAEEYLKKIGVTAKSSTTTSNNGNSTTNNANNEATNSTKKSSNESNTSNNNQTTGEDTENSNDEEEQSNEQEQKNEDQQEQQNEDQQEEQIEQDGE